MFGILLYFIRIYLNFIHYSLKETKNQRIETENITIVPHEKRIATSSTGILRQRLGASSRTIGGSSSSNIIRLKPSASERYRV